MPRIISQTTCLFLFMLIVLTLHEFFFGQHPSAQNLGAEALKQNNGATVFTNQTQDEILRVARQEAFTALMAKAQSEGSVRVIVGLRVDGFKPEGALPDELSITAQRAAITRAQARVQKTLAERFPTAGI